MDVCIALRTFNEDDSDDNVAATIPMDADDLFEFLAYLGPYFHGGRLVVKQAGSWLLLILFGRLQMLLFLLLRHGVGA